MTIQIINPFDNTNVEVKFSTFPGGEEHVRVAPNNLRHVRVQVKLTSSLECMRLVLLGHALEGMGITYDLIMPYIPYARQDRKCNPGEAFSLKHFCDMMFSQITPKMIRVADPHSHVAQKYLPADKTNITDIAYIVERWPMIMEELQKPNVILVAPDKGAIDRVHSLEYILPLTTRITCGKVRNPLTGNIIGVKVPKNLDKDATYFIIDDICDGGRTFIEVAKELRANGATKVCLFVTHGIFSNGLRDLSSVIDSIWTTNSFNDRVVGVFGEMEVHLFDIFSIM